jgi:ElaB/YqjD/DUF883 family membrane-anchored ribosome-binding protein
MKNNAETTHTPKELFTEMQALVTEAKSMMADSVSEHTADAVSALRTRFEEAHVRFNELYATARTKVVAGAKCTDVAIRENPYQSMAIAAGVGLVIGILVGRRSS